MAGQPNRSSKSKIDTVAGVVCFWVPGTTIHMQSGVFSHCGPARYLSLSLWCNGILENVMKEFESVCFFTLPPPPPQCFLALFFSVVAFFPLSCLQMVLWGLKSPGVQTSSSDTSLAESIGSPAGIVKVKLKNNKTCQCTFPGISGLKKAAVALIFPFYSWYVLGSLSTVHCLSPSSLSRPTHGQHFLPWPPGQA